jgi:hypothetical protein
MDALGIDSGSVLHHATPRIFYGCELHPGARGELLGFYPFTESKGHAVSVIASLWRQRWLAKRIRNPEVLSRVAATDAGTQAAFFSDSREVMQLESVEEFARTLMHRRTYCGHENRARVVTGRAKPYNLDSDPGVPEEIRTPRPPDS